MTKSHHVNRPLDLLYLNLSQLSYIKHYRHAIYLSVCLQIVCLYILMVAMTTKYGRIYCKISVFCIFSSRTQNPW